ncbi:MAG: hypothetical protein ACP5RE_03735 [Candidatus Acidifodinimicrobium sp.]
MSEREKAPFPFLPGMIVGVKGESGYNYYKIKGQAQQTVLTAPYLIGPNLNLQGQTFTVANISAFQTNARTLKQWVTWVDNQYLGVNWVINGTTLPQVNGVGQYLTIQTSPAYSYDIQFYSIAEQNIQASYNLYNLNPNLPIRGILKVVLNTMSVEPLQSLPAGQMFTDISVGGVGVPNR